MLVHLAAHLDGHRRDVGPALIWLIDLFFVLQRWHDRISIERVSELMPGAEAMATLLRVLGFLRCELGRELPPGLDEAARQVEPLTLEEVLRQRRLAPWQIPAPRGWLRLAARRLSGEPGPDRLYPRTSDLWQWPADAGRRRRSVAAATDLCRDGASRGSVQAHSPDRADRAA